jgi:hypothetical protein
VCECLRRFCVCERERESVCVSVGACVSLVDWGLKMDLVAEMMKRQKSEPKEKKLVSSTARRGDKDEIRG